MVVSLAALTREAVLAAVAEYDRLGREAFLAKYGFDLARQYFLEVNGRRIPTCGAAAASRGRRVPSAPHVEPEHSGTRPSHPGSGPHGRHRLGAQNAAPIPSLPLSLPSTSVLVPQIREAVNRLRADFAWTCHYPELSQSRPYRVEALPNGDHP
jgi:hypothetical protein